MGKGPCNCSSDGSSGQCLGNNNLPVNVYCVRGSDDGDVVRTHAYELLTLLAQLTNATYRAQQAVQHPALMTVSNNFDRYQLADEIYELAVCVAVQLRRT